MIFFCPGAQKIRQPSAEGIICPFCSEELEIWSDEIQVTCPNCKNTVMHQREGVSCLDWCSRAKDCVGEETYNKYINNKEVSTKQKLLKNWRITLAGM